MDNLPSHVDTQINKFLLLGSTRWQLWRGTCSRRLQPGWQTELYVNIISTNNS